MKKFTLRTALMALALLCSGHAWAATGDVTTNVNIDFSNPITDGVVAGTVNSMTLAENFSGNGGGTTNITDGVLFLGGTNSYNVVTIPESERARSRDIVTVEFDLGIGNANGLFGAFYLQDAEGNNIAYLSYGPWNAANTNGTNLGITLGENIFNKQNTPDWNKHTHFIIVIDYNLKKITTTTQITGSSAASPVEVALTNLNPVATFNLWGKLGNTQDRHVKFDNLLITTKEGDYDAASADYKINWVINGNDIKSETRSGEPNSRISLNTSDTETFWVDSQKYFYVSDDLGEKTIAENGSTVINITVREAATWTGRLITNDGDEISSTTAFEGENVTLTFPRFNLQGTDLYETTAGGSGTSSNYTRTFALTSATTEQTISYSKAVENVIYYSEGENIEGAYSFGIDPNRASNSRVGATNGVSGDKGNLKIKTLTAGKYKITAVSAGNAGSGSRTRTYNFLLGEDSVYIYSVTGSPQTGTSEEITVNSTADLTFSGGYYTTNSSNAYGLDLVYIQKTADYTEDVTIQSIGFATYSSENAVDFSGVDGLKAYIASENKDGEITFTPVTKVAAGQGVLLQGEAKTYTIPATDEEVAAPTTNYLKAATEEIAELASEADGKLNYILNNVGGTPGFYAAAGRKVAAGKAYLQLPAAAGAKAFIPFNFGLANAIETVSTVAQPADSRIYNLSGQRLSSLQKGLNIVNGKKIYVK